jgi:TrmH family RNA methyltransferase
MSKQPMISSLQHAEVKLMKALSRRKERMELGLFVNEGTRFIEEAAAANAPIVKVYYTAELLKSDRGASLVNTLHQRGILLQEVTLPVMDKIADTERPQGILATVKMTNPGLPALDQARPLVLVCDKIQDPGNLGAIIRTADAAGVHAIFTTVGTVDIYNPKILRATMGSIFHVPIFPDLDPVDILQDLQKHRITSIGATLGAAKWHFQVDYRCPIAFWLGNEGAGINEDLVAAFAEQVKIPMPGRSESLNVSVAASILIYECVRQRMVD